MGDTETRLNDQLVERRRGALHLSTDRSRINVDAVLEWLVSSHWGGGMTRVLLERAIANSVCIGVYQGDRQVAFARVVTDLATYGYLTDVIVAGNMRNTGIGSWMVESIVAHPDLQTLRRLALWTRDAPSLYARFGFSPDLPASTYMELRPKR